MFRGEERPPARRGEGAGAAEGAGPPPPGSQPHFLGVRGDHSLPGAASGATDRPVRVHLSLSISLSFACACRALHTRVHIRSHPPGGLGYGRATRAAGQWLSTLPRGAALACPPPAAGARGRVLRGGRRGAGRDALRLPPAAPQGQPRPERRFSCAPLRSSAGTEEPPCRRLLPALPAAALALGARCRSVRVALREPAPCACRCPRLPCGSLPACCPRCLALLPLPLCPRSARPLLLCGAGHVPAAGGRRDGQGRGAEPGAFPPPECRR